MVMRWTWALLAAALCGGAAGGGGAPGDGDYAALKAAALARPRGFVYNTDGCDILYWPTNLPVSVENFTRRRLVHALGTRITTISYCPQSAGFGHFTCRKAGEPLTGTVTKEHHGVETARNAAQDFFDLGTDALEMASAFCRTNNLEIFVSIRVNDQHDASSSPRRGYNALFPRFKKEHPECLMGAFGSSNTNLYRQCRGNWSCVNFACGLVRDEMRRFVREFLENYDVDGIEFDFNRHCVLFKSVAEGGVASPAERALMTGLMRDIRQLANEVGRRRGRYFVLAMRAPDSAAFCRDVGIDLERWLAEGLVDIWIGSGYFRLSPWGESVALAHRHGVKFYASLDESRIERACLRRGGLRFIPGRETLPAYAAVMANALASGADGIYVFNREGEFLRKIAQLDPSPANMSDKIYFVRYRGSGGYTPEHWLKGGSRHDRLPKLDPGCARESGFPAYRPGSRVSFDLMVGDDFAAVRQKPHVVAKVLTNLANGQALRLDVNGRLHDSCWSGDGQFHYALDPAEINKGTNMFSVTFPQAGENMTLNDFALEVRYPRLVTGVSF